MEVALAAGLPADRVTDDPIERKLYSRDLAPVPALMSRPFFRTVPEAVVRPGSAEQVALVLLQAERGRTPVTPRAAATTSYYNTVPVRGGLVLDVNDLRGVIRLDPDRRTIRVLPATTWLELDEALRWEGFAVKSYPSSAVSATVGGWASTQGHGIGSLKHGSLGEQLVGFQVALPNGDLRALGRDTDPPLDWFLAAEGTLGVITEVELSVRPRPEVESHHLFAFEDPESLGRSVLLLARSEPRPFTLLFADDGYLGLLARAGFGPGPLAAFPASEGGDGVRSVLLASFQGEPAEVARGREMLARVPGRDFPPGLTPEEWGHRLYHLRAKRAGPSLLAAEQWLPLEGLPGYLEESRAMADRHRLCIGNYGVVVTRGQLLLMSIYPTDERRTAEYLAAMGLTRRLHNLGARYGGRPYGVGLWNTPYLSRLFTRPQRAELGRRKARLDPSGIMNPGKLYRAPFPLWPVLFGPAAEALAVAYTTLGRSR